MWEIGNRGVVGLLSVFVGSVILYNAWGLILVLAILLFFVVNTCYSLLVNDSLVSRHNLLVFRFVRGVVSDLSGIVEQISVLLSGYIRDFVNAGKRYYRQRFNSSHSSNMNRPRRSSYHLSSESFVNAKDSSFLNTNVNQLSPIPREKFQHIDDWSERTRFVENNESLVKCTSTPLIPWRNENLPNGEPQHVSVQNSPPKISPLQGRNHTLSRGEETFYSPEGSPWGTSISPKMRAKAAGVKTVQTVAGPLLASTRYNIDTKVYTDVTSPGLTTRLSKYASEINNKLLHQPQYGMGHFPKVNLNASPTPLINTKAAKMRMPVTVRIAQPEVFKHYSSKKDKLLRMECYFENQTSPNVVQALREISLKRHASREDVTTELVKKQRTDGIYSDELENLEEMTQKRARDESSKSDEEISPSNTHSRPLKRTKGQSCNDILNSFSSSVHVFSGVKRKATDISRSSTPDFEKHFKSLEKYPSESFSAIPQENEAPQVIERYVSDPLPVIHVPIHSEPKPRQDISPKEIVNIEESNLEQQNKSPEDWEIRRPTVLKKPKSPASPVKLSDKLFMRPGPQNNDKLRIIIEEQSSVKDKFSMADKDEIKKKDIVNMRQTSMRARLQSMFDAISGKGASKINPDVVIQAGEDKNQVSTAISTPLTALSSTTTTTNVNTSPISSPIVPILKNTLITKKSPIKHVTFCLPSEESTTSVTSSLASENISCKTVEAQKSEGPSAGFSLSAASSGNATASTFTFGTNTSSSSASTIQVAVPTSSSVDTSRDKIISGSNFMAPKPETTPSITSIFSSKNTPQDLKTSLSTETPKSVATSQNLYTSQSLNTTQSLNSTQTITTPSSNFAFGAVAKSPTSVPTFGQSPSASSQKTPISLPSTTFSTPNFNSTNSTIATSSTPAFSFGASKPLTTEQNTPKTQAPAPFGSVTSSFSFSTNAAPTSSISNLNKVETTSSGLNNPVKTSNFSFGNTPASKPGFSFGNPSTTTSSAPMFGVGNSTSTLNTATNVTNPTTTCPPSFGMSTKTTPSFTSSGFGAGNNSNLNFGTSNANDVKSFGTPATSASLFGTPTCTTSVSFKAINSQPIFGNSSSGTPSAFGPPKTTASIFVANSNPSFGTATSPPSLFNNSNVNTTTSNLFNQVNTGTDSASVPFGTSTTSSGIFNNANTNVTSSNPMLGTSSNIFNQSKPPAFGATSSNFGNTGTSLFATPATNPTGFNATSPGTSAAPSFGTSTSTPLFGAQNTGTAAAVSQNSSFGFNTTTSNTPSFGSTPTTAGFGTSPNNNFQAQNNTGIAFGAGNNNPPAFGSSTTSAFGSQGGSVFGTNAPPAPAFGAGVVNNNNNNSGNNNANPSGAFTFGGGQSQTQSSSSFLFGGTATNNNSSNNNPAAPFQFGTAAPKPASGFNFTAPSATPNINFGASGSTAFNAPALGTNNFNAPAGGTFSIGTGSTAPRSRTARSRRQR